MPAIAVVQALFFAAGMPLSLASQLLQWVWGVAKIVCLAQIPCGSGLARDSGGSGGILVAGMPLSLASQLLQWVWGVAQNCLPGADPLWGLPAIAVVQAVFLVAGMPPSLASQLLQWVWGVAKVVCLAQIPCGSGLARDGGGSGGIFGGWYAAIAGKPAPTLICGVAKVVCLAQIPCGRFYG